MYHAHLKNVHDLQYQHELIKFVQYEYHKSQIIFPRLESVDSALLQLKAALRQWLEEVEDDLNNVVLLQSHLMSQSRHENLLDEVVQSGEQYQPCEANLIWVTHALMCWYQILRRLFCDLPT